VLFLFICYGMPSGLVLYWTVQNLFSIVQLIMTKHHIAASPAPAATPATVPTKSQPRTKVKSK
jgi:membrane protein insertase Oxa1/YidC/SpoIIIJ